MSKKNTKRPSLCLVMIVKNESKVIKRCIDSVKDYIDHWVIVDTGSTDGTQKLIIDLMDEYGIKGELHERPWVDFGFNRTESLNLSKGKSDYRLVIDADDFLTVDGNKNPFENLTADSYKVKIRLGSIAYFRTQVVKGDQDWRYVGVLHEYVTGPKDVELTDGNIEGAEMLASVSGDGREIKGTKKYYNDALIFEKALNNPSEQDIEDNTSERYTFYMAQSYRDANMPERSIEAYEKRVELGGWDEEVYISKYWIARQKQNLGRPEEEVIDAYMKAWEFRPNRLEALYHLIKYLGGKKRYVFAFALATIGMKSTSCQDILFVEDDIWTWRLPDEYSVLAYYNGNSIDAHAVTKAIMDSPVFEKIPTGDQERIVKNMEFYTNAVNKAEPSEESDIEDATIESLTENGFVEND